MRYSFVFVCQEGPLEVQAMLLAASLRRNARRDHQLVAAVPTPEQRWGRPRAETLRFLRGLGVEVVPITNQIDTNYPIGNKVSCLLIDVAGDVTVFVDSDILCLRAFSDFPELEAPFCAAPADFDTFRARGEHGDQWNAIYRSCNLPVPAARMKATVSGEVMPPYFNAGFIAAREGRKLGEAWLACCRRIDANPEITNKRPWLDQIALPVAVAQLALEYRCLDHRFNYPCHVRMIDPGDLPTFAHYHWPRVLLRDRVLRAYCKDLRREHPALADTFRGYRGWRWLTYPSAVIDVYATVRRIVDRAARVAARVGHGRRPAAGTGRSADCASGAGGERAGAGRRQDGE
jgi:hypothetical protein